MEGLNSKDKFWLWLMKKGKALGCHQRADRSFFYNGKQFPVCARCTGVFIGQIASIIFAFFISFDLRLSFIMLFPPIIDWGIQLFGIKESNNIRRLVTGIIGGFGFMNLYIGFLKFIIFSFV